MRKEANIFK